MGFKENLKNELAYQGLLVKELAAKAGVHSGSISNYLKENSSIPAADVAVKLAKALHVSVEYLVTGEDGLRSTEKDARFYSSEVRQLADALSEMDTRERGYVAALIDAIRRA